LNFIRDLISFDIIQFIYIQLHENNSTASILTLIVLENNCTCKGI